ncbi:MAG: tRNA threonylcarbamoyladenosine biosynthesis protein TsaB [Glaciecola sp.]|jgi:tRNA threonylcarbamoyladenosine biosynthesis protein TsaB
MLLLAIESSTRRSSVALVDDQRVVASSSLSRPMRHGEFLAPAIDFCLSQADAAASDITGVVAGLGPGLFTGLRVGLATAQAFAGARNLPVVGINGLDVLAFGARTSRRTIVATIDARRKEVFWAIYRSTPGGVERHGELRVSSADTLSAEVEALGEDVLYVGEGAMDHRETLRAENVDFAGPEDAYPVAANIGLLAVPRFQREETHRPEDLQPIYLRGADAKIGWQTRGKLAGGVA